MVKLTWSACHCFTKASTSRYFQLIKKCAAFISLTVVFSGSFALNTQPAEAKTSRNSLLRATIRATNDLVPPPPPYIPTIVPSMVPAALSMMKAQAKAADDAVAKRQAKTSRNSFHKTRNYFVPPPPPYQPSIVLSAVGMTNPQAVSADDAVVKKPVNNKSNYILARNQVIEKRILNQIDSFDNKISSHEKEICKLLNL